MKEKVCKTGGPGTKASLKVLLEVITKSRHEELWSETGRRKE